MAADIAGVTADLRPLAGGAKANPASLLTPLHPVHLSPGSVAGRAAHGKGRLQRTAVLEAQGDRNRASKGAAAAVGDMHIRWYPPGANLTLPWAGTATLSTISILLLSVVVEAAMQHEGAAGRRAGADERARGLPALIRQDEISGGRARGHATRRSHGRLTTRPGSAAAAGATDSASASAQSAELKASPAAGERSEGDGVIVGLRNRFIGKPQRVHDQKQPDRAHHRRRDPDHDAADLLIGERVDGGKNRPQRL